MALSYAAPDMPKPAYLFIRAVEQCTGARFFNRAYQNYLSIPQEQRNFWNYIISSLGYDVAPHYVTEDRIPAEGPLVVVANHPHGLADGASIAATIDAVRNDLRIIVWDVVTIPEEFRAHFLPLDLRDASVATLKQNVAVRREAIAHLKAGGSVLIFPAGAAEITAKPWSAPEEAPWTRLAGKLIAGSNARILPIHVEGHNSRWFHALSHLGQTVRNSLYVFEARRKRGDRIPLNIGPVIEPEEFRSKGSVTEAIEWLRNLTLSLSEKS